MYQCALSCSPDCQFSIQAFECPWRSSVLKKYELQIVSEIYCSLINVEAYQYKPRDHLLSSLNHSHELFYSRNSMLCQNYDIFQHNRRSIQFTETTYEGPTNSAKCLQMQQISLEFTLPFCAWLFDYPWLYCYFVIL